MVDEISKEILRVVFDSVEAYTGKFELGSDPFTPSEDIFSDLWIGVVDIGEHPKEQISMFWVLGKQYVGLTDNRNCLTHHPHPLPNLSCPCREI